MTYIVVGVKFEKAWCGNDEFFKFAKELPREILCDGEKLDASLLEALKEAKEAGEPVDDDYITEIYDEFVFDLVTSSKMVTITDGLLLQYFFSCDEEGAIFGVQIDDLDDAGEFLNEKLNDWNLNYAKYREKLLCFFEKHSIPVGMDDIKLYSICDW